MFLWVLLWIDSIYPDGKYPIHLRPTSNRYVARHSGAYTVRDIRKAYLSTSCFVSQSSFFLSPRMTVCSRSTMEKGLLEKSVKTCSYWGSKLCLGLFLWYILKRTGKTAGKINDCFDSFWGSELSLWLLTWYILKEIGKCWKNLEKPGTLRWSVSASPPFD